MSSYTRPRIDGATIFFTVTLAERGSDLLVQEIGTLREAVRDTLAARPFPSWEALDRSPGIGPRTLAALRRGAQAMPGG